MLAESCIAEVVIVSKGDNAAQAAPNWFIVSNSAVLAAARLRDRD